MNPPAPIQPQPFARPGVTQRAAPLTEAAVSAAMKALCVAVFLLTGMPRFRYVIAGVPIYFLDIAAALAIYLGGNLAKTRVTKNRAIVILLQWVTVGIVASQINNVLHASTPLPAIYMLVRYGLIISLFYSIIKIVRTPQDFQRVVCSAVLGLLVTASLTVMVSLPFTRGVATSYVLSNPMLEPAAEILVDNLASSRERSGTRGTSLVGTSTLTGGFVSVLWPLAILLTQRPPRAPFWRNVAKSASVLGVFGAIMTYARGAIAGILGALLTISLFGRGRSRGQATSVALIILVTIGAVGFDSKYFFFDRIATRMDAVIEGVRSGEFEDVREADRLQSYIAPFEYLAENPASFFLGAGNTRGHATTAQTEFARHSTLASSHYYFGFLTAIVYTGFVFTALVAVYTGGGDSRNPRAAEDRILFASLVAMIPWWVLGHAPVSLPRGMGLVMVIVGLVVANQEIGWRIRRERQHQSA